MLATESLTLALADRVFCRDLSLTMHAGEHWAILGPNGSGKSTLLRTFAGLQRPGAGRVLVQGHTLDALGARERARTLALLPQQTTPFLASSVFETAAIGRYPYGSPWRTHPDDDAIVRRALADVDLLACEERTLDGLSGGELRRVAIAATLAQTTPIRLLDEPTNHLDPQHQHRVLQTINASATPTLNVSVLHDVNLAARYCTHGLLLGDGWCLHGPLHDLLTRDLLSRLYRCPVRVHETGTGPMVVFG